MYGYRALPEICHDSSVYLLLWEQKENQKLPCTVDFREKPQGGGVFFRSFLTRLAKIKTPPPWAFRKFLALIFFPLHNWHITNKNWFLALGFFLVQLEASQNKNPTPWGFSRKSTDVSGKWFWKYYCESIFWK